MNSKNKIKELRGLQRSTQRLPNHAKTNHRNNHQNLFDRVLVDCLQSQLMNRHGYQLTRSSLPVLSLYFEYHDLLKQVITQKHTQKFKNNRFLTEYNRYYSEEKVSQLLEEITNKNKQFRKQATIYRQQCLLKYFQYEKLTKPFLIPYLAQKINKAKTQGNIKYEVKRSRKRQHTLFPMIEKQNKVKNFQFYSSVQTRKNITDRQNKVYYQILSLKMVLQNNNPDPTETNRICQQIKNDLQNLFHSVKIKPMQEQSKKKQLQYA